jgi:hypothetical protein
MNKSRIALIVGLLACAAAPTTFVASQEATTQQVVAPEYMKPGDSRTFSIEYLAKVAGVPDGSRKLRVWLPVPPDSTVQTIRDLAFSPTPEAHERA